MKPTTYTLHGVSGLLALALAGCGGSDDPVKPDPPAASISLAGSVATPTDFTSATLKAKYTEVEQTVSYLAGTTPTVKTYLGVSLFDVVQDALAADNKTPGATNPGNAGRRLIEHYVLATSTDGYQVAYSLGELSPGFGGSSSASGQPLIAYAEKAGGAVAALDDSTDGPFRITVPGDIKGGRYASNAVKLEVGVPSATPYSGTDPAGGQSTTVIIDGKVKAARTFTVADLKALPVQTAVYNGTTYKGAGLYDLLKTTVGLTTSSRKNAELSMYAVAIATDGFRSVVSLGEISPSFGNRPAIVAYEREHDTDPTLGPTGALRLIISRNAATPESAGARQVSNLAEIQVFEAGTP